MKKIILLFLLSLISSTAISNENRFVISEDKTTVKDSESTLLWQRDVSNNGYTWAQAYDYCDKLSIGALKSGWKLPTLKELSSLVVEAKKPFFFYIDETAFPNTLSEFFWSSSASDTQVAAIFFDMSKFPTGLGPDKALGHVRCVQGKISDSYKPYEKASYNLYTVPRAIAK